MLFPSRGDYEVVGVFNPGAIVFGDEILLLLRVAERPKDKCDDEQVAPILNPATGEIELFRVKNNDPGITDIPDSRSFYYKDEMYLTSISHLRLARSKDGIDFRIDEKPAVFPELPYETFGLEDPRITQIDGVFYITYKVVSRNGICTGLITTTDFINFEKHGIIFCPENIDVVLFPEKIGWKLFCAEPPCAALYRSARNLDRFFAGCAALGTASTAAIAAGRNISRRQDRRKLCTNQNTARLAGYLSRLRYE